MVRRAQRRPYRRIDAAPLPIGVHDDERCPHERGGQAITVLFSLVLLCGLLSVAGGWILSDTGAVISGIVLVVIGGVSVFVRRQHRRSSQREGGHERR